MKLSRTLLTVTLAGIVSGCSPVPVGVEADEVLFLVATTPATVHMEALFDGRVERDSEGCLRLDRDASQTVVWPHGFSLQRRGGAAAVVDNGGRVVGTLGGRFVFGGGEVPLHDGLALSAEQRQLIEQRCPGRLWIVGAVVS
jgi:hypothetical protein